MHIISSFLGGFKGLLSLATLAFDFCRNLFLTLEN